MAEEDHGSKAEGYTVRRAPAQSLGDLGQQTLVGYMALPYIRQGSVWPWEVVREHVGTREAVRLAAACEMMMMVCTGDMYLYSVRIRDTHVHVLYRTPPPAADLVIARSCDCVC
jgi:hypothetical protein